MYVCLHRNLLLKFLLKFSKMTYLQPFNGPLMQGPMLIAAATTKPMQWTRGPYAHIGVEAMLHSFQAIPAKGLWG